MLGFLNLNKPVGLTSHDCVAKVRRLLKLKRIGHGGTLDPAADGVLPIAVGGATRLLSFMPEEKAYRAKIRLGIKTTTDDLEGEVIQTKTVFGLTQKQIEPLLSRFVGQIQQIPPVYSAIQQGGKRLYELARKGEKIEVAARTVEVSKIEILSFVSGEFPELEVAIACGPGTYIRAIARDLGEALEVGGTLAALTRTQSCGFHLSESLSFEQIEAQLQQGTFSLIPVAIALQHLETIILNPTDARRWCQGQKVSHYKQLKKPQDELIVRVEDEAGNCLGIGEINRFDTDWLAIPKIVLQSN